MANELRSRSGAGGVRRRRPAFSFIEVMFAVSILGAGAITIAAGLSTALAQVESTADDSTVAMVGRNAVRLIEATVTDANVPANPGTVRPLPTAALLWPALAGNVISSTTPRYAWVAMYRRDTSAPVAQVFVVVVRARNRAEYAPAADLAAPADPADPDVQTFRTLEPRPVAVTLTDGGAGDDVVRFADASDPNVGAVAPGAFLVISSGGALGETAGRVYRIGERKDAATQTWYLQPGYDLRDAGENLAGYHTALVVGRGALADFAAGPSGAPEYAGPAQEVGVFIAYVKLR